MLCRKKERIRQTSRQLGTIPLPSIASQNNPPDVGSPGDISPAGVSQFDHYDRIDCYEPLATHPDCRRLQDSPHYYDQLGPEYLRVIG